jgi:hypothetical protein
MKLLFAPMYVFLTCLVAALSSKQIPIRTRRAGCYALLLIIGTVCVLCPCPAASAEELGPWGGPTTLSKIGKADHELVIRGYVRTDANCAGVEPPAIDLDVPPVHGIVCLRRTDDVLIEHASNTRCLGRKISGVKVVYLPRRGYAGSDSLRYIIRFPRITITHTANVTIVPDAPASSDAVPGDISAPTDNVPQSPGPIPACTALVS